MRKGILLTLIMILSFISANSQDIKASNIYTGLYKFGKPSLQINQNVEAMLKDEDFCKNISYLDNYISTEDSAIHPKLHCLRYENCFQKWVDNNSTLVKEVNNNSDLLFEYWELRSLPSYKSEWMNINLPLNFARINKAFQYSIALSTVDYIKSNINKSITTIDDEEIFWQKMINDRHNLLPWDITILLDKLVVIDQAKGWIFTKLNSNELYELAGKGWLADYPADFDNILEIIAKNEVAVDQYMASKCKIDINHEYRVALDWQLSMLGSESRLIPHKFYQEYMSKDIQDVDTFMEINGVYDLYRVKLARKMLQTKFKILSDPSSQNNMMKLLDELGSDAINPYTLTKFTWDSKNQQLITVMNVGGTDRELRI